MKISQRIKLVFPIVLLLLLSAIVVIEQIGVRRNSLNKTVEFDKAYSEPISESAKCVVLTDQEEVSQIGLKEAELILRDMKIAYEVYDLSDESENFDFSNYQTAVITFQDFHSFGKHLDEMISWVYEGGSLMTMFTPLYDENFSAVKAYMGIEEIIDGYPDITGILIKAGTMIGAKEDTVFTYDDALNTSLGVNIGKDSKGYIYSADGKWPLLWRAKFGEGRFVVNNMVVAEKYQRGIWGLSYSLLEPVSIYPVIDGSTYYLDDFPAPIPGGTSSYIQRDYGVDVESFFSAIWWPQIVKWENQYHIKHTGVIIETYEDEVEKDFNRNYEINQYITFGNALLNGNGELGFHGYNHQPLCLEGVNDSQQFGSYKLWKSEDSIYKAITELQNFSTDLFPENKFQVYVPPSNIMSEEGLAVLKKAMPDLKVVASTFMKDAENKSYSQEFGLQEDGTIDAPRITSGCIIDDYMKLTALSELNLHYVQSHFMHPDDVLDEDRGAKEGWAKMSEEFEKYLQWVSESAEPIRQMTGSEFGEAVQDFSKVSVSRELTRNSLSVRLGGFSKNASFLMRINEGHIQDFRDCKLEKIYENLYLVRTDHEEFSINVRK